MSDPIPLPDIVVPGHELLGVISQGTAGVVCRARQQDLDRIVAVKILHEGRTSARSGRERFEREARAVARLSHPRIVQVFAVGQTNGRPWFTMEFVDGESLAKVLHRGPMEAREAARLMQGLAEAMQHAHDRGVVHRDLKPANILIDTAGVARVADFGLAALLEGESELTLDGQVVGTPAYMAPEQAEHGGAAAGPKADIYGLGAILYALLTGRPPFLGRTASSTLEQLRVRSPVKVRALAPEVPEALETICHQALQKIPEKRYETPAALAEDLGRFLNREPIHARSAGALERVMLWARRNRGMAALAGLLAVVTIGALFLGAVHLQHVSKAEERAVEGLLFGLRTARPEAVPALLRSLFPYRSRLIKSRLEGDAALWADARARVRMRLLLLESDPTQSAGLVSDLSRSELSDVVLISRVLQRDDVGLSLARRRGTARELREEVAETHGFLGVALLVAAGGSDPGWWEAHGRDVVNELLELSPSRRLEVLDALASNWDSLESHLFALHRDGDERASAALIPLCSDSSEKLVALTRDATAEIFRDLREPLKARASAVRSLLTEGLPTPRATGDPSLVAELMRFAKGACSMVTPSFAMAERLSLEHLPALVQRFRDDGYHVLRVRPREGRAEAAVVWLRDARATEVTLNLTAAEVSAFCTELRTKASRAEDVAGYQTDAGIRYLVVSVAATDLDEWDALVGLSTRAHQEAASKLLRAGFEQRTQQTFLDREGTLHGCAVFGLTLGLPGRSLLLKGVRSSEFARPNAFGCVLDDLGIDWIGSPAVRRARLRSDVEAYSERIAAGADVPSALAMRSLSLIALDRLTDAHRDLDKLLAVSNAFPRARRYLAWLALANGDTSGALALARRYADEIHETEGPEEARHADELLALLEGDRAPGDMAANATGEGRLPTALTLALVAATTTDEGAAIELRRLSGELFASYWRDGGDDQGRIVASPECGALWTDKQFLKAARATSNDLWLDGLWRGRLGLECRWISPRASAEHAQAAQDLAREGFYPVSVIGVDAGEVECVGSVWHRRALGRREEIARSRRVANRALMLALIGDVAESLRTLRSADPSDRLRFAARYARGVGDIAGLLRATLQSTNAEERKLGLEALLGFSEEERESVRDQLVPVRAWAKDMVDEPGVRAVAERLVGRSEALAANRRADAEVFAAEAPEGHVMIHVRGPRRFLSGAPPHEAMGAGEETLFDAIIPRSFAVAEREVTVGQFLRFLDEQDERTPWATPFPGMDLPAAAVPWRLALAYCRWLTAKDETLGPDDQCYAPDSATRELRPVPGFLGRRGYRLPTELEWELVARAGVVGRRRAGLDLDLFGLEATWGGNSDGLPRPVARGFPNRWGLFDTHGNVSEFCHGLNERRPDPSGFLRDDDVLLADFHGGNNHAARGSSYETSDRSARFAARRFVAGDGAYRSMGFRIAQTIR